MTGIAKIDWDRLDNLGGLMHRGALKEIAQTACDDIALKVMHLGSQAQPIDVVGVALLIMASVAATTCAHDLGGYESAAAQYGELLRRRILNIRPQIEADVAAAYTYRGPDDKPS